MEEEGELIKIGAEFLKSIWEYHYNKKGKQISSSQKRNISKTTQREVQT